MKFGGEPRLEGMIGQGIMAMFASVVEATAFHSDGDDIERGMVVEAAGLWIELEAEDCWRRERHENDGRRTIAQT
ncbi:MAG TPA: hypothetical protein VMI32_16280 [Candidatus Solibacter sp.]|nr:hypothetical protein [Candidatus Solibacter sp.]